METLCCKQSSEFTTNYITGCNQIFLIPEIYLLENGWMIVEGNVQPVWFVGKGLSPNLVSDIKRI